MRNRYNLAPHLTHDTNGKVTTSQLAITNESKEVSPFPVGDHKVLINRLEEYSDTNGKVTTSQLAITNESKEVSPFPVNIQSKIQMKTRFCAPDFV